MTAAARKTGVRISPRAQVSPLARIGEQSSIWDLAQVGEGAAIGRDVVIGSNVYIDHDVLVGDNSKIQNGALIYWPARIEDGVFIGPGVILTNDQRPRAVNPDGSPKGPDDWEAAGVTIFLNEYEEARQELMRGTGVRGLYVIGRNGEFSHILMEDVYWRTKPKAAEVVAGISA